MSDRRAACCNIAQNGRRQADILKVAFAQSSQIITGMPETLPIEIVLIAAAASKLSVIFFIVKSPFFRPGLPQWFPI